MKFVKPFPGHRHADQTSAVPRHEIDGTGSDPFRSHCEVAFVFAILIIDYDDNLPPADLLNGFFDSAEHQAGPSCNRTQSL